MKIYVAAPWIYRSTARGEAQQLRDLGFDVVSRWHEDGGPWSDQNALDVTDPKIAAQEAAMDFLDVLTADAMVVLNLSKSEGKAVEQGIALAAGTPIIVIGSERFNVFQYLDRFTMVPDFASAVAVLRTLQ